MFKYRDWYFVGITNSAIVSAINLNNNIIRNLNKTALLGIYGYFEYGAVFTSISINGNQLGNTSGDLITYSAANSTTFLGISNSAGTASCEVSIQNNDIRVLINL
jgi:hypothetical protein